MFFKKNYLDKKNDFYINYSKNSSYDILKPKFAINNLKEKINVTANEGNFINDDEILLKNNVLFKSSNFKIFSNDVTFDKRKQTANSKSDAIFIAEKTKIESKGFDIIDQGNIILFNGKTHLILSK
tara:strand:- start:28 stop:405 length:378 start_codon:yes stop_codon:yes gene_type:complete